MSLKYGDKRDFPKIDIFVNGKYEVSTTWSKNCKEAKQHFLRVDEASAHEVACHYSQKRGTK